MNAVSLVGENIGLDDREKFCIMLELIANKLAFLSEKGIPIKTYNYKKLGRRLANRCIRLSPRIFIYFDMIVRLCVLTLIANICFCHLLDFRLLLLLLL